MIIKYFDEYEGAWLDISGETGSVLQYGASGWTSAPTKKVYNALISQTGTDAPEAIELENSLGAVTWSYVSSGIYQLILNDAFKQDKYFAPIGFSGMDANTNNGSYGPKEYEWYRLNNNKVEVRSPNGDGYLSLSPISIIVYV
jgi:hypothetical protein